MSPPKNQIAVNVKTISQCNKSSVASTGAPLGPGRLPHEGFTVWPDLLNDLPKLGLVTNVQNQVCGPLEVELQDVNEPSRGGDHYLSS